MSFCSKSYGDTPSDSAHMQQKGSAPPSGIYISWNLTLGVQAPKRSEGFFSRRVGGGTRPSTQAHGGLLLVGSSSSRTLIEPVLDRVKTMYNILDGSLFDSAVCVNVGFIE